MTHADSIRYLERAGFHYKPPESPDLWAWLESHFARPRAIGSKFNHISTDTMAELIAAGEIALLDAMVDAHRQGGALKLVRKVIDLPYVVGTEAALPLNQVNKARILSLIASPGTLHEHLIHVVPTAADEIPCTTRMTVTGGLYADGCTAGYYDLYPGDHVGANNKAAIAWLATPDEIVSLVHDMEAKADDIAIATRMECDAMIAKAKKLIG